MASRRALYLAVAAVLMLATAWLGVVVKQVEPRHLRHHLERLPQTIGVWRSMGADRSLDQDSLDLLKPEAYLLRNYRNPAGMGAALFVAFFGLQQEGQMIHSPRNCLPGAGWQIQGQEVVEVPGGLGRVNALIMVNGPERMSVLYWYQGRGRVQANEYGARLRLLLDGVFMGRTDGALVRITTNLGPASPMVVRAGQLDLARGLIPALNKLLPAAPDG